MRRVLMLSPHFPPDTSAGAHRVRLLAPHLPAAGWEPTVLTVAPGGYEGRLDPALAALVPPALRVIRTRAISSALTRPLGLGDLGLRSLPGLALAARGLLRRERFDALFITIYPSYPAVLGPGLSRRFGVPFVLDYQDPWVGSWGETVGGGKEGEADLKSRLTRRLAERLEPRTLRGASGVTAVSRGTWDEIVERNHKDNPGLADIPFAELPLGGDHADFEAIARAARPNGYFDPHDGDVHLCYVGTLLPLGFDTLRAVLAAVARLRDREPERYSRLRLLFFGTSNQTAPVGRERSLPPRVLPVARELGVADRVTEVPGRIPYLDALRVLTQASALLLMGSSEPHYTASKLYPALLARRPVLATYHRASSVNAILESATREPSVRRVPYGDGPPGEDTIAALSDHLAALVAAPVYRPEDVDLAALEATSARQLAGRLGEFLDSLIEGRA